jgi:cytochrome c553
LKLAWRDCHTCRTIKTNGGDSRSRRKAATMKVTFIGAARSAGFVLLVALGAPGAAIAADDASSARQQNIQTKLDYCQTCHGPAGQGYVGYYTMPRLAGQPPQYIVNQLQAFTEKRRINQVMLNVAHGLTPAMYQGLAHYFASQNPPPFGGGPRVSLALGRAIFANGLPESNVPACAACHGATGHGQRQIPRLAGQLYSYVVKALSGWGRERGQGGAPDISAIMGPTSHNLTAAQISAIAAYVSTLK